MPSLALPWFSRYFPPAVAKVYIVSFRTLDDRRPSKFIVLADNMQAVINKAWEHGGADFQSRFDKSTAQAQEMKEGVLPGVVKVRHRFPCSAPMTRHTHQCLCGETCNCIIRILPLPGGGRVRCERVWESICPGCFDNMMHHATVEDLESMARVCDPLTAWRARERIE
jgi:hypothetical protein